MRQCYLLATQRVDFLYPLKGALFCFWNAGKIEYFLLNGFLESSNLIPYSDRLYEAHENFITSMVLLDQKHQNRLNKVENTKLRLRRHVCPRLGRLMLENSSFRDLIMYGMPKIGREIGRGKNKLLVSRILSSIQVNMELLLSPITGGIGLESPSNQSFRMEIGSGEISRLSSITRNGG